MNVVLNGRGVEITDRLRGYATEKLTRLQRLVDRITRIEVELVKERNPRVKDRHRVEVAVVTPRAALRAHGAGADHFTAIDQAAERIEGQVRKRKGRVARKGARQTAAPSSSAGGMPRARSNADRGRSPDGLPRVVRLPQTSSKPMTAEEAALELDDLGFQFLLFTNADTMRAGVVYRRTDGSYGLIEHV